MRGGKLSRRAVVESTLFRFIIRNLLPVLKKNCCGGIFASTKNEDEAPEDCRSRSDAAVLTSNDTP